MEAFSSLEDQVRECFGRVVYTHKTHEKMADGCSATLRRLKLIQIGLAALTASGAASSIFVDKPGLKIGTALLSFGALWISGYMKGFDPGGTAQKHRDAAAALWPIRESYLSLLTEMRMRRVGDDDAIKRRDELQAKLAVLYKSAPHTTPRAYAAAQKALQRSGDYTFSDAEIDKFVPSSLRKGG